MTYTALIAEIAQHPVDERLALLETVSRTLWAEISSATPGAHPRDEVGGGDLTFPDDPALAALEAQFE